MENEARVGTPSKVALWTGYVVSALPALMLLFSGATKFKAADFAKDIEPLGWELDQMPGLGVVEIACAVIYLFPNTAVLGAILITGYLGGAIATHVRIHEIAGITLPIILGVLTWGGLYLRLPALRALVPFRR